MFNKNNYNGLKILYIVEFSTICILCALGVIKIRGARLNSGLQLESRGVYLLASNILIELLRLNKTRLRKTFGSTDPS